MNPTKIKLVRLSPQFYNMYILEDSEQNTVPKTKQTEQKNVKYSKVQGIKIKMIKFVEMNINHFIIQHLIDCTFFTAIAYITILALEKWL